MTYSFLCFFFFVGVSHLWRDALGTQPLNWEGGGVGGAGGVEEKKNKAEWDAPPPRPPA